MTDKTGLLKFVRAESSRYGKDYLGLIISEREGCIESCLNLVVTEIEESIKTGTVNVKYLCRTFREAIDELTELQRDIDYAKFAISERENQND